MTRQRRGGLSCKLHSPNETKGIGIEVIKSATHSPAGERGSASSNPVLAESRVSWGFVPNPARGKLSLDPAAAGRVEL